MGVNSLPKTVTRQRRGCDLNPGSSAPESSTLTTRLLSHPNDTQPPNFDKNLTVPYLASCRKQRAENTKTGIIALHFTHSFISPQNGSEKNRIETGLNST